MPYDAVYPLGSGSKWGNNELRYSLRSLEKNLVDLRNVYIVGYRPDWLTGAIHISCDDPLPHNKDGNIIRKILRACEVPELSEEFLQVSDDQILLQPLSFAELRPYYVIDLASVDESWFSQGAWAKRMERTYQWLRARGRTTYHYDSHIPLPMSKSQCFRVMSECDYEEGIGYAINTVYFNSLGLPVDHPIRDKRAVFELSCRSTAAIRRRLYGKTYLNYFDPAMTDGFKRVLAELFPHKSRFEK
jgi:hypothetical protein